jgi:XRE family aerobic/anaerobic benzoate catabolism transcriptional regulator
LREAQGRSLTDLAVQARVSRRYLTEAEAGRANTSVLVLERLAQALGTDPGSLLAREAHPGRIALVGLRGAGKSTLGRRLALQRGVPFVELDQRVEALAGLSLAEVFSLHGASAFHRWEAEALEAVIADGGEVVLATGGSIVDRESTYARLLASFRTVWLRAQPEQHLERVRSQGDRRPMEGHPRALEDLRLILDRRESGYRRCNLELDTRSMGVGDCHAALCESLGL